MKKKSFFICTIVLTIALIILPLFSVKEILAKPLIKISKEKVTMYTNESRKIKIMNTSSKVTWYSTNKKIVQVADTSGKKNQIATIETGNKTGTCTIKAKVNNKVYKCKVIVKKEIPQREYTGNTSKLSLAKMNLSDSALSLKIKMSNASKKEKYYGVGFFIQKYVNGKWETLEMKDDFLFPAIAYIIPPKTSVDKTFSVTSYYDRSLFTTGKYRIHVECNCVKKSNQYVVFSIK